MIQNLIKSSIVEKISIFDNTIEVLEIINIDDFKEHFCTHAVNTGVFKDYHIYLSRTAKVVLADDFNCQSCESIATYAVVAYSRHSPKKSRDQTRRIRDIYNCCVSFWFYNDSIGGYSIMTKDHIMPKAAGGTNSFENLQCMCDKCNEDKGCTVDGIEAHIIKLPKPDVKNNNTLYQHYQRDARRFKKIKRRIKKMERELPWYYRVIGVGRFINTRIGKAIASMEEADTRSMD